MAESTASYSLPSDAPKTVIKDDEFGLKRLVVALADRLTRSDTPVGFVLGVEGAWGSGKSTLANFLGEEIARRTTAHQIVRFDPWLIGDKGSFLAVLLGQLAASIEAIRRPHLRWWHPRYWRLRARRRRLSGTIRKYGEYAAALAAPVGGAGALDASGATVMVAAGLKTASQISKLFGRSQQSLESLRGDIFHELGKLQQLAPESRITVIIDDTDRLEPIEAAEVLRLIRKAADFPLISYLVCFDQKALAHQVQTALNVPDGRLYIEKIFQNIVSVPPHEPFALRRYLRRLLNEGFPAEMAQIGTRDAATDRGETNYREHIALELWSGRFLGTPRDIVRLAEAVDFGWPSIRGRADFLDYVWLQLVRQKVPDLYDWTLEYVTNIAAYRDGGRPGESEPIQLAARLKGILEKLDWSDRAYLSGLAEVLPGLENFLMRMDGDDAKVFDFGHNELAMFENARRLGSPSHWRRYFAFDLPSYALSDEDISAFLHAAKSRAADAAAFLRSLLERPHRRRGHFVDVLLDRLKDLPDSAWSPAEVSGVAAALADTMDDFAAELGPQDLDQSPFWQKATQLMKKASGEEFVSLIGTARSINWMAEIIREQGSAHGRPDAERASPSRQWLTEDELDQAIAELTDRFRQAGPADIFNRPSPLDILFCWQQLGDEAEVREFVRDAMRRSDHLFLAALRAMQSWSSSSNKGTRYPLKRQYVEVFANADAAKIRLEMIAGSINYPDELRSSAKELLDEWTDERRE